MVGFSVLICYESMTNNTLPYQKQSSAFFFVSQSLVRLAYVSGMPSFHLFYKFPEVIRSYFMWYSSWNFEGYSKILEIGIVFQPLLSPCMFSIVLDTSLFLC